MRVPAIDVIVEAPRWDCRTPRRRCGARSPRPRPRSAPDFRNRALAVLLTDDAAIRRLNAQWRGIDKPTNVLSFPPAASAAPSGAKSLGDIAIAYETTAREAEDEDKPFADHLSHLCVHGFLHLMGYDHESEAQAETMEQLEREILARLGVPDPYLTRTKSGSDRQRPCLTQTRQVAAIRAALSSSGGTRQPAGAGAAAAAPPQRETGDSWLARVLRAVFGWKTSARADLQTVLANGAALGESGFSPQERIMLTNILALRGRRIDDVMVPRADIISVQRDISLGELIKVFEGAGHSRLVAYNETLDDPVGMVHIRDVIGYMVRHAAVSATQGQAQEAVPGRPRSQGGRPFGRAVGRPRSSARCCSCRPRCRRSTCSPRCRRRASIWRW